MTSKAADDFEAIRRRLEEIEAEQKLALTGSSAPVQEEPKDVESVYGYGGMCGMQNLNTNPQTLRNLYQAAANNMKSLAHPAWPYEGTGFEWRRFVRS